VLVFAGNPTTLDYLSLTISPAFVSSVESLSLQTHFESITRGVIEFKDIAYFIILIAAWISASVLVLEERKAS